MMSDKMNFWSKKTKKTKVLANCNSFNDTVLEIFEVAIIPHLTVPVNKVT